MVKVRALQKCFIGNKLREVGSVFEHGGKINEAVMIALESETPTEKPEQSKATKAAAAKKAALSATSDAEGSAASKEAAEKKS